MAHSSPPKISPHLGTRRTQVQCRPFLRGRREQRLVRFIPMTSQLARTLRSPPSIPSRNSICLAKKFLSRGMHHEQLEVHLLLISSGASPTRGPIIACIYCSCFSPRLAQGWAISKTGLEENEYVLFQHVAIRLLDTDQLVSKAQAKLAIAYAKMKK